jgi:hypothetical protein
MRSGGLSLAGTTRRTSLDTGARLPSRLLADGRDGDGRADDFGV